VKVVFKHMPLAIHPKARDAHLAAEAAHQQGKFWEMHDAIFEKQREMSAELYVQIAGEIGLNVDKFKQDLASPQVAARVDKNMKEAQALGVSGTPAFFINGRYLSGAQPFPAFKEIIDEELKKTG
jgi:protein-disulfide isomerase